tara:strand:+ start:430 stop:630 length:201 start_codon:yes stop_codon:yes gene_type:complete
MNSKFDIDAIQFALDDAEKVVFALQAARDAISEEDWEALPEKVLEVLDCACDLESSMGMDGEEDEE